MHHGRATPSDVSGSSNFRRPSWTWPRFRKIPAVASRWSSPTSPRCTGELNWMWIGKNMINVENPVSDWKIHFFLSSSIGKIMIFHDWNGNEVWSEKYPSFGVFRMDPLNDQRDSLLTFPILGRWSCLNIRKLVSVARNRHPSTQPFGGHSRSSQIGSNRAYTQ